VIFVDESVQQRHGYICTAFVYCTHHPHDGIASALLRAELKPGRDEFKSGARMDGRPQLHTLRRDLLQIIQRDTSIGLLITPDDNRRHLGADVATTLRRLIEANELVANQEVFLDEGLPIAGSQDLAWLQRSGAKIRTRCDSRKVLGIQLADHAAYHCSYMLKEKIEGPTKFMTVGDEGGYSPPIEAELGWVFWTDLRYAFFKEPKPWDDDAGDYNYMHKLLGYGAFVSERCSHPLKQHAREAFESVWMGCIH
jgi:hypothetical protein